MKGHPYNDNIDNPVIFRTAVIDLGSNATKMVVMVKREMGDIEVEKEFFSVNKLALGLEDSKIISESAIAKLMSSIEACFALINSADIVEIVTTHALRMAKNGNHVIDLIFERFGIKTIIISPEEESLLTFRCVASDTSIVKGETLFTVIDIGGGTSEMITGDKSHIYYRKSFNCGIVGVTEKLLFMDKPSQNELMDSIACVKEIISSQLEGMVFGRLIAIGGSVINLARVWKEVTVEKSKDVHGKILTKDDVEFLLEGMCALSPAKRKTLIGLENERADSIISGGIILLAFMNYIGANDVTISTSGLRHVIATDLFV